MSKQSKMATRDEVAEEFRVDTSTVDRWIKSGLLEACKFPGAVRIPRGAIEKFLKKHTSSRPA